MSLIEMEKEVSAKIQKKLDNIINLKFQLKNWEQLSEEEVLKYVKEFEKTPRDEGSSFYNEHFNDTNFANTLTDIAKAHSKNSKVIMYIISALGNMMRRYKLPETEDIYKLMIDNSQRKGVAPYVAIYLPKMDKFNKEFQDKWDYYISIKKTTPKKLAETKFLDIIEDKLKEIPPNYKKEVIDFLENKKQSSNSDYSKNRYSDMIESINS